MIGNSKSISRRALMLIIPTIVVCLASISFLCYQAATAIINNEIQVRMENQLDYVSTSIDQALTTHGRIALALAKNVEATGSTMTKQQYETMLRGNVGTNADTLGGGVWFEPYKYDSTMQYFGPYVYRDGGNIVYTDDYSTAEYDYPNQDWYKIGVSTDKPIVWSGAYYDPVAKVTMVTATAPFYDGNKKFLGVTTADIDLTSLQSMITGLKIGRTGRAFLVDGTGLYLADADSAKVMQKKVAEDPNKSLAALSDKLLAGKRSQESFADGSGKQNIYFLPISETGWVLAIVMPEKELYGSVNDLMIKLMIISLIVLVIISLIIYFVVRSIVNPIKSVTGLLKNAGQGDFTGLPPRMYAKRQDEIGQLIQSYEQMAGNISEQVDAAERISRGDLNVNLVPRSGADRLSGSIVGVASTLDGLLQEINALSEAAVKGDLKLRANAGAYSGQYFTILDGINNLLDEMEKPVNELKSAGLVAARVSEYQRREVSKLVEGLGQLSAGALDSAYEVDAGDKDTEASRAVFAMIHNNFSATIGSLRGYIDEITAVLSAIAAGDLDVKINSEYKGEFIALKDAINAIIESLNSMFTDINAAANQVASGTSQVSGGAQTLSQGATEQASAIEQLTASVEQIANQTRQNALDAGRASSLTAEARDYAVSGNNRMREMLKSMQDINDASASISKIIKVIDEIAFQTNLLALNAAVEAARAGQYGKGFAVVAEEVRNLAARSANAAKETSALIEGTVAKAKSGMKTARETADALDSIVTGVEKASELVAGIAAASNEQATAVAQVSRGIEQVAQVVQSTSATAEESAATSEELSGQAEYLKEMVGRFRLRDGQSVAEARRREIIQASGNHKPKARINLGDREFGKY